MGSPASSISGGGGGSSEVLGTDAFFSGDNETYLTASPSTATRNLTQPTSAAVTPLTLKGAAAQTAPLLLVENSAGTDLAQVTAAGLFLAPSGTGGAPGWAFLADPTTGANLNAPGVIGLIGANWLIDYQSLSCFRNTACLIFGGSSDAGIKWAAAGVFRLLAGLSGLGALLAGQLVRARTADLTLTVAESGIHYTNTGAGGQIVFTLPAATLTNEVSATYQFTVTAAQNLRVQAAGTDTIQIAGAVITAGGGNVTSNTIAATLRITCTSTGAWTALAGGVWV